MYLSPQSPPNSGGLWKILVPPELGARGRLIFDLARFYDLYVHDISLDGGGDEGYT
jgi:hypothetical protein